MFTNSFGKKFLLILFSLRENRKLFSLRMKRRENILSRTYGTKVKTKDKISQNRRLIVLGSLFILGLLLRLYRIEEMFVFDYDQEVAANAAYDVIKNHKISLVGQELSFQGFFLGPIHNLIQVIPYGYCQLKPDCVPYFFVSIGIIVGYLFYISLIKIFNPKIAVISTILYLISSVIIGNERTPNSNYFLFLVSTLMLVCLNNFFQGKKLYLILGGFLGGLAVINFNPIFIFTLAAYFITAFIKYKNNLQVIILSIVASLVNIAPLIIFNFRHENILLKSLVSFFVESKSSENIFAKAIFIIKEIALPYFTSFLFNETNLIYLLITLTTLVYGAYLTIKSRRLVSLFLLIWVSVTILGFTFYKRHIPDYYFIQTLPAFIILVAIVLSKKVLYFIPIISMFLYSNIFNLLNSNNGLGYKFKKDVVTFLISDSRGEDFNVYRNFPMGLDTGYSYLFKAYEKTPKDFSKNLYILDLFDDKIFSTSEYFKTFNNKIKKIIVIGPMKILIIKN